MSYSPRVLIFILSLLIFVEYAGDPILRAFTSPADRVLPDQIFKFLISFFSFLLMISFGLKLPRNISLLIPFILFMSVLLFGLAHGILVNAPSNAVNEVIPYLFILLFFVFSSIRKPISVDEVEFMLKIMVYIVTLKVLVYIMASFAFYGFFSWKVLTKQSPLLVIPLCVFLSNYILKKKSNSNITLLFLIIFCIMFAQARMLLLACIFVFSYYFLGRKFIRAIPVVAIIGLSLQIYLLFVGGGAGDVGSFFYGGQAYEDGMSYRLIQLEVLLSRLIESPFIGVGFGHFTVGYLDYYRLAKPYLLELDILNFISKIGLIGLFFYGLAYVQLFFLIKKISDDSVRRLSTSLFISLIALMIYSLGQTAHQAVTYWIFLAFVYGFIVSHLKAQYRK